MKSRLSYFLISGIIILSILTATLIWRNQYLNEIPALNEKSFAAPISSQYIPNNADLVFQWKINPSVLPEYIENFQDKTNKNIANKKIKLIRDSSFNLINLDFTKDISKWSGEYGSFAIFDTNNQLNNDWLMVLEMNKEANTEEILESILSPSIIDGDIKGSNNLNTSRSTIISKKVNSNQSIFISNSNEHILISSNPKIIKSSKNHLKDNTLSTKERYKDIQLKENIQDGILLLEMSPQKIISLLDQREGLLELNQTNKLISSINIEKNTLTFEGVLAYDIKKKRPVDDISYRLIDTVKEFDLFDDSILIDNPKQYFRKNSSHPYQKLIASIIQASIAEDYSNILKTILENTKGPLIWLKDTDWLVLERKDDTDKQKISEFFKKENSLNSTLEVKNRNLEIWSRITTNSNEKYEIKENIDAIIEEDENIYVWSQDLSSLLNLDKKKYLPNNLNNEYIENKKDDFDELIRIHLGKKKTELLLQNFYPYILLRTMLGNKLNYPKNIDISISIPTINYPNFIKYKVSLQTS